jgi:3'(2'), 5'-bisphosphate nucleotidase
MINTYSEFNSTVILAARATQIVQEFGLQDNTWHKDDNSPVTIADLASQAILLGKIADLFPDERVFAEESTLSLTRHSNLSRVKEVVEEVLAKTFSIKEIEERINYRGNLKSQNCLYVDPIDGTKGYLKNLFYAVAIARTVDNSLVNSWMAVPCKEELMPEICGYLFNATKTEGVRKISIKSNEDFGLLPKVDRSKDTESLRLVASRAHETVDLPTTVENENQVELVSMDSQVKYAALANGVADIYPRKPSRSFGSFFCWDHLPGMLLVQETGGVVTDLTGKVLDWSNGERLTNNLGIFAASTPAYHKKYQRVFNEHGLPEWCK